MTALDLTAAWPVPSVSGAVIAGGAVADVVGDTNRVQRLASISKPIAAWAVFVALEEGIVTLDQPIGQPDCTLRHLLAHAGGYPFEGSDPISPPDRTRIYSNTGFDLACATVADAAVMPFAEYLRLAVFEPLAMTSSQLIGSPSHGVHSNVDDLIRFVLEVRTPTLVAPSTAELAEHVHSPALAGIVPGVGRYERCPWGMGFEVRGDKHPHWTGRTNSARTFGHFGGSGTMFWVDPTADVALIALADRPFDEWATEALEAWPTLSDAVLDEYRMHATHPSAGTTP